MVFKQYARKLRYAKIMKMDRFPPIWVIVRKFGRITSSLIFRVRKRKIGKISL